MSSTTSSSPLRSLHRPPLTFLFRSPTTQREPVRIQSDIAQPTLEDATLAFSKHERERQRTRSWGPTVSEFGARVNQRSPTIYELTRISAGERANNYRAANNQDRLAILERELAVERAERTASFEELRREHQRAEARLQSVTDGHQDLTDAFSLSIDKQVEIIQRRLDARRIIEEYQACDITLQHMNDNKIFNAKNKTTRILKKNALGYIVQILRFQPTGEHNANIRRAYRTVREKLTEDEWLFAKALLKRRDELGEVRNVIAHPQLNLAAYEACMMTIAPQFSPQLNAILAGNGPRKKGDQSLLTEDDSDFQDSVRGLEEELEFLKGLLETLRPEE
ncbi:hypothetical protein MIND_00428600 [Mycena indigotica]|uniref:Uncharacterized protein n=1 Tax=Mycena indigotica TaxID=2126181 RepID=A0A8H6W5C3_9AGAR|nr:uncharacterized protein MIND_00428600 [Mycena indigotica]KAF7306374.1 hypothetical protein MIND_00428600 [Mycena indigotica]